MVFLIYPVAIKNRKLDDTYQAAWQRIKNISKKAVVVVNDSNHFGFVLYGLKSKDFKQLDKLLDFIGNHKKAFLIAIALNGILVKYKS